MLPFPKLDEHRGWNVARSLLCLRYVLANYYNLFALVCFSTIEDIYNFIYNLFIYSVLIMYRLNK
jgi:hypothetical protein